MSPDFADFRQSQFRFWRLGWPSLHLQLIENIAVCEFPSHRLLQNEMQMLDLKPCGVVCGASRLALSHVVLPVLKANLVRMGDSLALQERQYFGPGLFVALPRVGVEVMLLQVIVYPCCECPRRNIGDFRLPRGMLLGDLLGLSFVALNVPAQFQALVPPLPSVEVSVAEVDELASLLSEGVGHALKVTHDDTHEKLFSVQKFPITLLFLCMMPKIMFYRYTTRHRRKNRLVVRAEFFNREDYCCWACC